MSDVTSANFTRNKGTFAGGAIFADEASTTISSNEYLCRAAGAGPNRRRLVG